MKRGFGLVACVVLVSTVGAASACSSHSPSSEGVQAPSATGGAAPSAVPVPSARSAPAIPAPNTPLATPPLAGGKRCGGIAGLRCAERQYCAYSLDAKCGAGDMAGVCQPVPEMCTMEYAPVCGCDGKTYGSTCVAARAGVSPLKAGSCASDSGSEITEGKPCGSRGAPGTCAEGLYCAYRALCGALDSGGTCSKKPVLCNHLDSGVCGCDGKTYPNACHAARAGVSVSAQTACKTP